jgi:hypothetical protein
MKLYRRHPTEIFNLNATGRRHYITDQLAHESKLQCKFAFLCPRTRQIAPILRINVIASLAWRNQELEGTTTR